MRDQKKTLYWVWLSLCFPPACPRLIELLNETDPETFYKERTPYPFLKPEDIKTCTSVSLERAQAVIERCRELQADILTMEDEEYPESLLHIYCPPPVLYVRGTLAPLSGRLAVSVVGTRDSYEYYNSVVGNISYQLAKAGAVVISGCAVGGDSFAHTGCIKGRGPTVGVLACGIDVDYPKESHDLKEEIVRSGGALVSELEPGRRMSKGYFHSRNRLIAGLADCVLLGQVPFRSGVMITANAAIDQGKEIFCIPPANLYDAKCMGIAEYIRCGAQVVFSAYDIVSAYRAQYGDTLRIEPLEKQNLLVLQPEEASDMPRKGGKKQKQPEPPRKPESKAAAEPPAREKRQPEKDIPPQTEEDELFVATESSYQVNTAPSPQPAEPQAPGAQDPRTLVLSLLTDEPQLVDDLLGQCGLQLQEMLQILTGLELEGLVEALSGQRYRLA